MICERRTDKEVLTISVCLYYGNSKLMAQQKVRHFLQPQELFLRGDSLYPLSVLSSISTASEISFKEAKLKDEINIKLNVKQPVHRRYFIFLFVLLENIGVRESEASTRGARERKINFSSSPTPTPLRWRSINPPRFIFYHARSTDFEGKIEGL